MHTPLALLLALAAVPTAACTVIDTTSKVHTTGREISAETFDRIREGQDRRDLLALLGEPTSRAALEDGVEVWRWVYTERRESRTSLILVLDGSSTKEQERSWYVELEGGRVVRKWRD